MHSKGGYLRTIICFILVFLFFGCSTLKAPEGYEVVKSSLNNKYKLLIVKGSNLTSHAKRHFVFILHSMESNKDTEIPIKVISIDSYGKELEIWTVLRSDGSNVDYYMENVGNRLSIKNPETGQFLDTRNFN